MYNLNVDSPKGHRGGKFLGFGDLAYYPYFLLGGKMEEDKGGWIKLHRKITKWEWYDDVKTLGLWVHILINANWEDKKWHGIIIHRGEFVTSQEHLCMETKLTRQQLRFSLLRLKATNNITSKTTNKYTLITVVNYDAYQDKLKCEQPAKQPTEQPTNNQQTTITKEYKKEDISSIVIKDQISAKAEFIYNSHLWDKVHIFTNSAIKYGCNMDALLYTLEQFIESSRKHVITDQWGYCKRIMQIQNGNFNEREAIIEHEEIKGESKKVSLTSIAGGKNVPSSSEMEGINT